MATTVEREPQIKAPEQAVERPSEFPEEQVQQLGGKVRPTQFPQKTDDTGQTVVQTPASKTVTIQLPDDEEHLKALSKGKPTDAVTGFAKFWLRMVKKALHYGWKVVVGNKT